MARRSGFRASCVAHSGEKVDEQMSTVSGGGLHELMDTMFDILDFTVPVCCGAPLLRLLHDDELTHCVCVRTVIIVICMVINELC